MMKTTEKVIVRLKELIDENGPGYITEKPYDVYKKMTEAVPEANIIAGAILMMISCGIWQSAILAEDCTKMSGQIQKCCFNKKMTDQLTEVIQNLYSADNKTEWKSRKNEGLRKFRKVDHTFKWEGFSVWDAGNGTVDCYYNADIMLRPVKPPIKNATLDKMLKKNPFMNEDDIFKYYEKDLKQYLDSEFEEYCNCDDYYQPVVEDYDVEYDVKDWCSKNGFEIISCEGEGNDGGYEPKFIRRW
ncbi:hypothetical protein [Butyrivibrio sp.]|uniref:hypothetical protein n=1 Tax=Butyrivibrio sp. TaxID=28121 RepID=UPI0025C423C6|nr:hypothetical protein [Butyrivibrio sp.]MBQ9301659.1 hypothetical protein [Butyrivibrio sp.]